MAYIVLKRLRAYRADFYARENIVGYTGQLYSQPTVYFRCGEEFGRITQQHENPLEVGREEVLALPDGFDYVIENQLHDGKLVGVETLVHPDRGVVPVHTSREKFIDCRRLKIDVFATLAQAIRLFPGIKSYGQPRGELARHDPITRRAAVPSPSLW